MGAFIFAGGDPSKVDVSGYTKGDVLAADTTGTLQPVTVGPDGDVLTADSIATEGVDWQPGGGGGGASPGNTVVTEQAFGQASASGALLTYSRSDHTHGTPAAPSIPSASGSVVTEQTFGQSSTAGVAATFSRGDHTHGTPAAPAAGTSVKIADSGPITSGTIVALAGLPYTTLATVSITAVTGDYLGIIIEALFGNQVTNLIFDAATRVAGVDHFYFSSGTGTPLFNGARPPWYIDGSVQFATAREEVLYRVQASDVVAGTVTVRACAAAEGPATKDILASAAFPLRVWLKNYGQGT